MSAELQYSPFSFDQAESYGAMFREECPVHIYEDEKHKFYVMTRHADVRNVLIKKDLFTERYGHLHTYGPGQGINVDPPIHTMWRRLLNPLFTPARVAERAARFEAIAEKHVANLKGRGTAEFYEEFALGYTVEVAGDVLGIDPARRDEMRGWAKQFIDGLNIPDHDLEMKGRMGLYGYLGDLMEEVRKKTSAGENVPDTLISTMVAGRNPEGRPFTNEELLPVAILVFLGGIDTTAVLLSNCVYRLLSDRPLWERLCADPALVPAALEESLRFDSPVFGLFRTNEEAVTMHGVEIPKDSKIQMNYAAGNRDPAVFPEPDRFSLDRDPAWLAMNTLAFGGGIHTCLGNTVARLSARLALAALLREMPSLRLNGEARRLIGPPGSLAIHNGIVVLPVRWDLD